VEVESLKGKSSGLIICFLIFCFTFTQINTVITSNTKEMIKYDMIETEQDDFSEIQIEVSSLGTFLRAEPKKDDRDSMVQEPTIIDLESARINGSKWISINYSSESFSNTRKKTSETEIVLIGLFSLTSELKPIEFLRRVPGAIDSGRDYKTDETYFDNLSTDIPEDFIIRSPFENVIEIPRNAKFLFLCIADTYYPDNSGTIQVTLTKLEEYQVIFSIENLFIIFEIVFIVLVLMYYRKK
jgi:hypothetical protein